ncbi:hypothetical protein BKA69DRAFT_1101552 [Paraphysoderma sedebokerense]|nr:hypothetical protein BKA69DRAFT_1101552 [Paraphysoderma sedebokerense]
MKLKKYWMPVNVETELNILFNGVELRNNLGCYTMILTVTTSLKSSIPAILKNLVTLGSNHVKSVNLIKFVLFN